MLEAGEKAGESKPGNLHLPPIRQREQVPARGEERFRPASGLISWSSRRQQDARIGCGRYPGIEAAAGKSLLKPSIARDLAERWSSVQLDT